MSLIWCIDYAFHWLLCSTCTPISYHRNYMYNSWYKTLITVLLLTSYMPKWFWCTLISPQTLHQANLLHNIPSFMLVLTENWPRLLYHTFSAFESRCWTSQNITFTSEAEHQLTVREFTCLQLLNVHQKTRNDTQYAGNTSSVIAYYIMYFVMALHYTLCGESTSLHHNLYLHCQVRIIFSSLHFHLRHVLKRRRYTHTHTHTHTHQRDTVCCAAVIERLLAVCYIIS